MRDALLSAGYTETGAELYRITDYCHFSARLFKLRRIWILGALTHMPGGVGAPSGLSRKAELAVLVGSEEPVAKYEARLINALIALSENYDGDVGAAEPVE